MAQTLRCDTGDDYPGSILIQDLVDGKVIVACSQCAPMAVRALGDALGVTQGVWDEAQAALMQEVEKAAAKREKAAARGKARKSPEPQDTPPGDASTVAAESPSELDEFEPLPGGGMPNAYWEASEQ